MNISSQHPKKMKIFFGCYGSALVYQHLRDTSDLGHGRRGYKRQRFVPSVMDSYFSSLEIRKQDNGSNGMKIDSLSIDSHVCEKVIAS